MRTQATFRLAGRDGRSAAYVGDRLGLTPSSSREAGELVGPRSAATYDESLWSLSSSTTPQDGIELSDQLQLLLAHLEPVTTELWELVNAGYQANWLCYLGSHSTEHASELDRLTLGRLSALPGDLWIDVHSSDVEDE
jgi:hypothetical protein